MDYFNKTLFELIEFKFENDMLKQFDITSNPSFIDTWIGFKLKELFNNFIKEYEKINCSNNDFDYTVEYCFTQIYKKLYCKETVVIFNESLVLFLEDSDANSDLFDSFYDIKKFIQQIPYISCKEDLAEEFNLEFENYALMEDNIEDFGDNEFEDAILYFEKLKNTFRCKNKTGFEYYDNLQERYYQILESEFGVQHENIPDSWNKTI